MFQSNLLYYFHILIHKMFFEVEYIFKNNQIEKDYPCINKN